MRKRVVTVVAFLLAAVLLGVVAHASATSVSRPRVRTLPGCTESQPCHFARGTYRLGSASVLPGLRLTLPRGWSGDENDVGELHLTPPGHPRAALFVWMDLVAVKSTGHGHGTTVLHNVGRTPAALVSWLTTNPDFLVVVRPKHTTIATRISATTLTIGVSRSARYGDPACPANPRCADLFTSHWWGKNSYGIGGNEEVQLSLAAIKRSNVRHTLLVALDAGTGTAHKELVNLRQMTRSIISSFRLPKSISAG